MNIANIDCRGPAVLGFVIVVLLSAGSSLFAADVSAQFRTGYGTSDNIARTSVGEIDEEMGTIGTTFAYINQTSRMDLNIRANADYVKYFSDTFDSQVIGGFIGELNYTLVPERLNWLVSNSFGQRLQDSLAAPNPGNRQNVNSFTTGPSFRGSLGRRYFYRLDAQYRNISLEGTSNFGNERVNGQVQFGRQVSLDSTISLNVAKERTEFDNSGLSDDFEVASAFLRYNLGSARNNATLDVGYSELETDSLPARGGSLFRMNWTRIISSRSQLITGFGSRYTDASDLFSFTQGIVDDVGQTFDTDGDDQPYRNNYAFARYNINSDRTRLSLMARWLQDDYEFGGDRDRDVLTASIIISRELTAKFFVNFRVRVFDRKYENIGLEDDQLDLAATLGFRINEAFDVSLILSRSDRESNVALQEFVENRGLLQFNYTPSWGRSIAPLN